jgi:hypothetical protein
VGKPYPPVATDHDKMWHLEKFIEFTKFKQEIGEPSPHMTLAGHLIAIDEADFMERVWRAGVYGAPYSVLTSEAIWREWPWPRISRADPAEFEAWIYANWEGFHIRTERRMVRTRPKMAECLLSWRDWMKSGVLSEINSRHFWMEPHAYYDMVYGSIIDNVMFFGRYITIRIVEFLRRHANIPAHLYDIRSMGGESPVRCLSLLFPEATNSLLIEKDPKVAEYLGTALLEEVQMAVPSVTHYVLAAMLCEYREAYEDHHQYPGRTIDQELEYLNGPKAEWWENRGFKTDLWDARMACFPREVLGELRYWGGIRHDLSRVLRDNGYNWSDLHYTYKNKILLDEGVFV